MNQENKFITALRTQQPAPSTQQDPVGWYVTGCSRLLDEDDAKAEARHVGGTARAIPLYTAPQPSPTAQADSAQDEPLQAFDSPRAKALMRAWEEGWATCRDAEYVGEEAQNDAFNNSNTLAICIAEDQRLPMPARAPADSVTAPAGGEVAVEKLQQQKRDISAFVQREFVASVGPSNAAPTPPTQTADSVLEDAARWRELREQHEGDAASCCVFAPNEMHECLGPVGSLPGELDAFMDAERAARKQGANHD